MKLAGVPVARAWEVVEREIVRDNRYRAGSATQSGTRLDYH